MKSPFLIFVLVILIMLAYGVVVRTIKHLQGNHRSVMFRRGYSWALAEFSNGKSEDFLRAQVQTSKDFDSYGSFDQGVEYFLSKNYDKETAINLYIGWKNDLQGPEL